MIKNWLVGFLAFCSILSLAAYFFWPHPAFLEQEHFISFEQSMVKSDPPVVSSILSKKLRKDARWKRIKQLYDQHILSAHPTTQVRIPKIIHQIWLGSPLPEKYKEIQATWKKYHPDWEYRLWTDEDAKTFPMKNRALFENAKNWGEKSDIFRYEILYQYGGLYVDTDFECLRPFDILHQLCDFYIGLDSIERKFQGPRLLNGLMASAPNHPILQKCLDSLSGGDPTNCDNIQWRTGPGLIARVFFECMNDKKYKNVALPATYFYPLPGPKRNGCLGGPIKNAWIQEESFAIHYWDGSWIPSSK
jgi:mannosyltransferase OCH1-like enzyme